MADGGGGRGGLLKLFRAKATDRLERLGQGIVALEQNPDQETLVRDLMREAHTLKGEAGMMGFPHVRTLAHALEDFLTAAQDQEFKLSAELHDLVFECLDRIAVQARSTEEAEGTADEVESFGRKLRAAAHGEPIEEDAEPDGAPTAASPPEVDLEPVAEEKLQGEITKTSVELQPELSDSFNSFETTGLSTMSLEVAAEGTMSLEMPAGTAAPRPAATPSDEAWIRVEREGLDHIGGVLSDIGLQLQGWRVSVGQLEEMLAGAAATSRSSHPGASPESTQTLGELRDAVERTAEAVSSIEERLIELRMQPLRSALGHYPQGVRNLARQLGRQVTLELEVGNLQLDREILDEIDEPLQHVIRNAVDHGIEPPDKRVRAGKPPNGTITIEAVLIGGDIEIQVSDDGRGVSTRSIRRKALEKGLLTRETAREMDRATCLGLLFKPGFSTRSSATEVSGRGMGLDIVRSTLARVGGDVGIRSKPGSGTSIRLRVPITRAITRALVVERGGVRLAIPSRSVTRVMEVPSADVESIGTGRCIRVEDQSVPLVDLAATTGESAQSANSPQSLLVVVLQHLGHHAGLLVDAYHAETRVVRKPFDSFLGGVGLFSGVAILAGYELVLQLNVSAIFGDQPAVVADSMPATPTESHTHNVMVAEDSDIARALIADVLRSYGFHVIEAFDGQDALDKLDHEHPELILTDIEMPRMNGFELIRSIRERPDTRSIPVIVLSTLNKEADRAKALEMGADAYIVKAEFHEKILRDAVGRFIGGA